MAAHFLTEGMRKIASNFADSCNIFHAEIVNQPLNARFAVSTSQHDRAFRLPYAFSLEQ